MGDWITIMTFTYPHEAHLAQMILQNGGIEVFLKDEYTVQVHPFYSHAIGGIKLQVPENFREEALCLLKEAGYTV